MVRDHCGWIDLDQGQELEDEFEADLQVVTVTAVLDTCETRLTLRPATPDDVEATWQFRRLDDVSRWLTGWVLRPLTPATGTPPRPSVS
ncbi:MAG TPA: hypothetical protein VGD71_17490 [Kribbella sp.]|jgi:hypothetical protein